MFCDDREKKIDVRVVKRGEYDEEVVRWADAIVSAGGMDPRPRGVQLTAALLNCRLFVCIYF